MVRKARHDALRRPKGRYRVAPSVTLRSRRGATELRLQWRILELWTLPVGELLATGDPGIIPWAPLAKIEGPVEPVLQRRREVIEHAAPEEERKNLLAVIQVLAALRYNEPRLLGILGGREVMIESPVLQELKAEWTADAKAEAVLRVLEGRLGPISPDVRAAVLAEKNGVRLNALLDRAAVCPSLEAFRAGLPE